MWQLIIVTIIPLLLLKMPQIKETFGALVMLVFRPRKETIEFLDVNYFNLGLVKMITALIILSYYEII